MAQHKINGIYRFKFAVGCIQKNVKRKWCSGTNCKSILSELRVPSSWQKFNCEVGLHPTQKPVSLFEYLIKTYTKENEIILDNCIGSGTTAVVALKCNRKFIGFEIESEYIEIANLRIEATYNKWDDKLIMEKAKEIKIKYK